MDVSSDVLVQLTTMEEETRHARERFQKTLDDIAEQNNIGRSPRIKTASSTPPHDVSDQDVNNLLKRLESAQHDQPNSFFSPMVANAPPSTVSQRRGTGLREESFTLATGTERNSERNSNLRHTTSKTTHPNSDHSWMLATVEGHLPTNVASSRKQSGPSTTTAITSAQQDPTKKEKIWPKKEIGCNRKLHAKKTECGN